MFYDLSVSSSFAPLGALRSSTAAAFCLVHSGDPSESPSLPRSSVRLYSRLDLPYSESLNSSMIAQLRESYDLVCLLLPDAQVSYATIRKLSPDLVRLPVKELKHIKKTFAGALESSGLYVEVLVRDGLYEDKVAWMNACRRLIRLGCRRRMVVSTGATGPSELREYDEICKILGIFGVGPEGAKKILGNGEKCLRDAAVRRYLRDGCLADGTDEGALKRDFVLNWADRKGK